jgi:hypothetical protein
METGVTTEFEEKYVTVNEPSDGLGTWVIFIFAGITKASFAFTAGLIRLSFFLRCFTAFWP